MTQLRMTPMLPLRKISDFALTVHRLFLAVLACLMMGTPSRAEITITLDKGNFQPLPIAITDFIGSDLGPQISAVITNDLKRSGIFAPYSESWPPDSSLL